MHANENIIVFDGVCVLCTTWLRLVLRHDKERIFRFATMQSEAGRALLLENGMNPDDPVSFLVIREGQAYSDTEAIVQVVSVFGGIWRAAHLLRLIPSIIRDPGYRFVARHRYRIFGRHTHCLAPDESLRSRFIHKLPG